MDHDGTESGAGVGDAFNGEGKADAVRLAHTAIIKQDVMLSGTSTQSPVSSVLTMPSVSMSTGSLATATMATSLTGALADHLFLGAMPSVTGNDLDHHTKVDVSAMAHAATQQALTQQQLLGQPQVAPQLILAGNTLQQSQSGAAAASLPVQQLLIPVSTGNGTQQLLTIPISLAAGGGNQIHLLTTANGQLIATNLASLTQSLNVNIPNTGKGGSPVQPVIVLAPSAVTSGHNPGSLNQVAHQLSTATQSVASNHSSIAHAQAAGAAAAAQMPQLIANAQGQIIAIGTPQMLQSISASQSSALHQAAQQLVAAQQQQQGSHHQGSHQSSAASATTVVNPQTLLPQNAVQLSQLQQAVAAHTAAAGGAGGAVMPSLGGATTTTVSIQQPVTTVSQEAASVTPNINQLLPNTISSAAEGTIVDGVNLDEIREFAKRFKIWRLSLGLTQTQVGQALSAREGPSYSQSAICRFEKLDITPKSAQKIKPVLERWMAEAEERYKNGMQNLSEFIGSEPSKKRKRRTSFTPQALEVLNEHFERNTHPSGAEMTELAEKLNYDREVIRVWFCNKRQALKNTIKKLKQDPVS